jgi:hypothetical protein
VKLYRLIVGIAALVLMLAVGVRSFEQAPGPQGNAAQDAPRTATAAVPTSPAPATVKPVEARTTAPTEAEFQAVTESLLFNTCGECHNSFEVAADLDLTTGLTVESLAKDRDMWDLILDKLKSREMPPVDVPRPEEEITALVHFLESEFERADALVTPDPGRVVARRLNRAEYTNTIRDLLAVDFRADRNFPTDDSGEGFDNISEILTVSPVLMEAYMNAAERIAVSTIAADPLPKPIEVEYSLRFRNLRRVNPSLVEATHRVDFDAEYVLRIGMPGERPEDAAPVMLGVWVDGRLLTTTQVETKPSGLVYFNPYSETEVRVALPEGDHTLRLGFIDDPYVQTLKREDIYKDRMNKWIGSMTIVGPFPADGVKPSRQRVLVCDPKTGPACVEQIVSTLARRAYRRPVTPTEVADLKRFVAMAEADGLPVEKGLELAVQAILVSPHFLFRIERDLYPTDPGRSHRVSDVELASRLSYFLWNSMPDEELLALAERKELNRPAVLDAQVKRMLADPRSFALAENFAGQWLEIRNLDSIKPDPERFPQWGPELREAMKTETQMFFNEILRENRPISEFLNARYSFLNEFLAGYYGIEGVTGSDFRRVDLATDQRGGVLTHGSVLSVSSYPTRTSVVIRGKYVLQNILGSPLPPPPPDVPALDEDALGKSASLRQQMEKHRTNAICASCHSRMDPLGFGLENYDAVGKWRTMDGSFPVDSSGTLPTGQSFTTPAEMREILSGMLPQFSRALTEKMLTYSLGRGLERYDRRTVQGITRRLGEQGYGLQTLVQEVVRSLPFQSRRAETVESPATQSAAR